MGRERLPVVVAPEADERLSSWIVRMAAFYAMTVPEFVAALGLKGRDVDDLEWRLSEGEGALIAARTGPSGAALGAMTFGQMVLEARMMIARRNRHPCPLCLEGVHRKSSALPQRFRCRAHGVGFRDATAAALPGILGADCFSELATCAEAGAAVLEAWARGDGQGILGVAELLALLTTRHRRASPPSVAEQPRMSLQTRRDYREYLTTPIIRQALTVVVPEYDRVAPVLTKPVRPGLHALAQGSLLHTFALMVGIGPIVEDLVDQAISVLLTSDAEGQGRVQEALRSWPLSLETHLRPALARSA